MNERQHDLMNTISQGLYSTERTLQGAVDYHNKILGSIDPNNKVGVMTSMGVMLNTVSRLMITMDDDFDDFCTCDAHEPKPSAYGEEYAIIDDTDLPLAIEILLERTCWFKVEPHPDGKAKVTTKAEGHLGFLGLGLEVVSV